MGKVRKLNKEGSEVQQVASKERQNLHVKELVYFVLLPLDNRASK